MVGYLGRFGTSLHFRMQMWRRQQVYIVELVMMNPQLFQQAWTQISLIWV